MTDCVSCIFLQLWLETTIICSWLGWSSGDDAVAAVSDGLDSILNYRMRLPVTGGSRRDRHALIDMNFGVATGANPEEMDKC